MIKKIRSNWHQRKVYDEEFAEWDTYEVMEGGVVGIEEFLEEGYHFCVVEYADGSSRKVFNLNEIFYK